MNFTLLDTKFSISIYLILGCIVLWMILSTNLFCAGCRVTPYEGFTVAAKAVAEKASGKKLKKNVPDKKEGFVGANINHGESSN